MPSETTSLLKNPHFRFYLIVVGLCLLYIEFYHQEIKKLLDTPAKQESPVISPGIKVSLDKGKTTEAGSVGWFEVTLLTKPTADVIIPITSSDPSEGKVYPEFLRIHPETWYVTRWVGVGGVDDDIPDGNQEYQIHLGPSVSEDPQYHNLQPESLTFVNSDVFTELWGTEKNESGKKITINEKDEIFVIGSTAGNIEGHPSLGGKDVFILKYTSIGTKVWVQTLGTMGEDIGTDITHDSEGNLILVGYTSEHFKGEYSQGGTDFFLASYSSSGERQWLIQKGTTGNEQSVDVVVDPEGNLIVSGITNGSMDGQTFHGDDDLFVSKFKNDGTWIWTRQIGTQKREYNGKLAVDSKGDILLIGSTFGTISGQQKLGIIDPFVVKWDSEGVQQWALQFGTNGADTGRAIVTDASNNIYITGSTEGNFIEPPYPHRGETYLIKLTPNGKTLWIRQFGASPPTLKDVADRQNDLKIDKFGNLYMTGTVAGSLGGQHYFGAIDSFLLKFDSAGQQQWVRQFGGKENDLSLGLALSSDGYIFLTGGSLSLLDGNTNQGGFDLFLLKYNTDGKKY